MCFLCPQKHSDSDFPVGYGGFTAYGNGTTGPERNRFCQRPFLEQNGVPSPHVPCPSLPILAHLDTGHCAPPPSRRYLPPSENVLNVHIAFEPHTCYGHDSGLVFSSLERDGRPGRSRRMFTAIRSLSVFRTINTHLSWAAPPSALHAEIN